MASVFKVYNVKAVMAALARAREKLDDLRPVNKDVTIYLLSLVQRKFKSGAENNWEPLSSVTLFVRRHRANSPTKSDQPLNDKGLLRNSNFPFSRDGGSEFGIVNNLKHASLQNFGGRSPGSDVVIRNFSRRLKSGGKSKVKQKFYNMTFKPAQVKARPFFPVEEEYMPGVRKTLRIHLLRAKRELDG